MSDFIPHSRPILEEEQLAQNAQTFYEQMKTRRTVRHFSSRPIPREVIENIIKTASTAPSGANKQPWTFAVIHSPEMKTKIRIAAEKNKLYRLFYE